MQHSATRWKSKNYEKKWSVKRVDFQIFFSILDKAQNGIKGNISENWTQKWTAGPVHLLKEVWMDQLVFKESKKN